jgi:hypothetical protein
LEAGSSSVWVFVEAEWVPAASVVPVCAELVVSFVPVTISELSVDVVNVSACVVVGEGSGVDTCVSDVGVAGTSGVADGVVDAGDDAGGSGVEGGKQEVRGGFATSQTHPWGAPSIGGCPKAASDIMYQLPSIGSIIVVFGQLLTMLDAPNLIETGRLRTSICAGLELELLNETTQSI